MILTVPPITLDTETFAITGRYGAPQWLAADQASMLATMMRKPGVIIPCAGLIQAVYGRGKKPTDPYRAIIGRIGRLRQVLDSIGARDMIRTAHDQGWMMTKPTDCFNGLHQRWLTDDQVRVFDALAAKQDHHA